MQPVHLDIVEQPIFSWNEYDLSQYLPANWDRHLLAIARDHAVARTLVPTSSTSRESTDVQQLPVLTVGGKTLAKQAPWLVELYETIILQYAQSFSSEYVSPAQDVRYKVNLNIQRGQTMRYECHVDSNPIEALLYVTSHPPGSGGELVVAKRTGVSSVGEVDTDCLRIYPTKSKLIMFDARQHAHYVAPLQSEDDMRVVVAMNFYTQTCSEAMRPADLNRHLFGED